MKQLNIKSIFFKLLCVILVLFLSSINILASAKGGYASTYEMTGGLFCRAMEIDKNCTLAVTITPTKGSSDCNMGIYLEKKSGKSWTADYDEDSVSSTSGGTITFKISKTGTYRLYLRNYSNMSSGGTGTKWKGSIRVSWS
ncbi:hypothetical protein [[Clostridium] polysaccharolyticum]|uniref:Uncharacterized protein n=1 Tax=[Clostridium] polysaccharolyticum TaxID=29364 RepID=A0A1I0ASH1_9FIRM|nr:hypothetical protein [[Clostridium] polysaccharolyticum]SES97321.1 hypothetical protein SAMN04487772_10625 [[Clostridium] polysaccharolyticum]